MLQTPMDVCENVVSKQVKVAPRNKTTKKRNKRALECSGSIGAPPEEWQEARNGGPRAAHEDPCGVQKSYKTQMDVDDAWF